MNGTDARASLAKRALPGLKENRAFYEGDHWQASTRGVRTPYSALKQAM